MSFSEVDISLNIQSYVDYPVQISILGNPYNLRDTSNMSREFRWDVTSFVFTGENQLLLQYKLNNAPNYLLYSGEFSPQNLQAVVDLLNNLGIGFFNLYTELGNTYIGTYNDNYVFGFLNIFSNTGSSSIINPAFFVGSGFSTPPASLIRQMAIQSGNRIIAAGYFTAYQGNTTSNIVRINSDGTYDSTFNVGGIGFDSYCDNVLVQADDKIVCIGQFGNYNGISIIGAICRLNSDGSLDTTFNFGGTGFNNIYEWSINKQSTEKIIIGGNFAAYNGNAVGGLVRLNTNGSYDSSFTTGVGFAGGGTFRVNTISIQSDDSVICGGDFTSYNGVGQVGIIRLTSAGLSDGTFLNINAGTIWSTAIQSDGKILVGGTGFATYGGSAVPSNLFRINANGTLDTTFNAGGVGFSGTVYSISVQSDGKIICTGSFLTYNTISAPRIIRLNADGTIDTSWNYGTGINNGGGTGIPQIEILSNGNIVIGGNFTQFQGQTYNNIIGLLS